ncbi:MAG: L-aspartate oxidase [Peptococcaceae bacterium]|nr:L-aspartate oxidase [Peptococcaceae bacterium]
MESDFLVNFDTTGLVEEQVDYIILGSGIAGLYTALTVSKQGKNAVVITKQDIDDSNTDKAQGGIAAALDTTDSPELHYNDTLMAGDGLCDQDAVSILVNEGPDRVIDLIELGTQFDYKDGELAFAREGAHSRRRILHASGDATGAEIQRILSKRVREDSKVKILKRHMAVDLLIHENICYGVLVYCHDTGIMKVFRSSAVILATGGLGMLYKYNTNPEVATGDGLAMAYRAGAEMMDMEFIQFHPTVLSLPGAPRFLISEAVRGEGAYLRNRFGERFMPGYHELAELAPRDIVVRAILTELANTASEKVFLDLSHLPANLIKERFPTIGRTCARYGLDIAKDLVPVAPAAHYMMGGVKTNLNGETSVNGLYACGEVACVGVHGANRLASNSLLDGLVFGKRIVDYVETHRLDNTPDKNEFSCTKLKSEPVDYERIFLELGNIMNKYVGAVRTEQGLAKALSFFSSYDWLKEIQAPDLRAMEVKNLLEVGALIAHFAITRTESRGSHYRLDYPQSLEHWRKHVILKK